MNRSVVVFAMIAALGVPAIAAAQYQLRGYVIGNGGVSAIPISDGTFKLYGTVGALTAQSSQSGTQGACAGFWCFGGPRVLDVPGADHVPTQFALGPAVPSPARDQVRFNLALPTAATVRLAVYDVSGRQTGEIVSRHFDAGEHELFWRAPRAETGVYFMRLDTDGVFRAQRTIVVVR